MKPIIGRENTPQSGSQKRLKGKGKATDSEVTTTSSTIQRRSKYLAWLIRWRIICQILHELDYLHHDKTAPEIPPLGTKLLHWFSSN